MPYVRYKQEGMTTMRQVAVMVGLHPSRYWRLVRERGTLEAPAVQAGRRMYYDAVQVAYRQAGGPPSWGRNTCMTTIVRRGERSAVGVT